MTGADCTCGHRSREGDCRYCRNLLYRWNWKQRNAEKVRQYERERGQRPEVKALNRAKSAAWRERNLEAVREREREREKEARRWLRRDRAKVNARRRVRYAVETGRLSRQPCEVCGATDVHAHHDDYALPLDVRWLCPIHHATLHRLGVAA